MKMDTGWPDALSKIGLAVMALCALATTLLTRCDAAKVARQQQKVEGVLKQQFSTNYVEKLLANEPAR